MSEEIMQCTPPELAEVANAAIETLIPPKSRKLYDFAYDRFIKWTREQNAHTFSENVLLAFFSHLAEKMKSSSLWAQYSMIKSELNIKHNVNIDRYTKLIAFLKRQSDGYKPKKSKVLSKEHFDNFMKNAPNNTYLATKVILLFGVTGACRCDELLHMNVNDIDDLGNLILVKIPDNKTKKPRSFTILGDFYLNLYRQYISLRPTDMNITRFFIKYQNSKCHRVVMGIHKISNVPKEVATYLKLPNPAEYTGHCLRRTSATLLVDNGADITSLKRHGGWKSTTVAEGYIEESITHKKQTAMKILDPGTSAINTVDNENQENVTTNVEETVVGTNVSSNVKQAIVNIEGMPTNASGLFQNCTLQNCTFNIKVVSK